MTGALRPFVGHGNPGWGASNTQGSCGGWGRGSERTGLSYSRLLKLRKGEDVRDKRKYHVEREGGVKVCGEMTHNVVWKVVRDVLTF